jgi:excisionase family DNA binding protein
MHGVVMAFTRREAADALRVSLRTLDYLLAEGKVHARRIGRRVVIPQFEIANLLRPTRRTRRTKADRNPR